jgi:hypothetical protein
MELSDTAAKQLLEKAGDQVNVVSSPIIPDVVVEPASPKAQLVWWEGADLRLYGPAKPEFLAQVGKGTGATFWVLVTYQGNLRWINSDHLKSRPANVNEGS